MNTGTATLDAGQLAVLEGIASGVPLPQVLEDIVLLVERQAPGMLCSVLLLQPDATLHHGSAPSLSSDFVTGINGSEIGPHEGSCGAAAYSRRPVVIADIDSHPNWAKYKHLAHAAGLRACWSTPILSSRGEVLGTFAMYYREPREPTAQEQAWVGVAIHLAAIAITHYGAELDLRRSEARSRELARLHAVSGAINKLIARTRNTDELHQTICRAVVDHGLAKLAWIGLRRTNPDTLDIIAEYGDVAPLDFKTIDLADERYRNGLTARAVGTGEPVISDQVPHDGTAHWHHMLANRGLKSAGVFPLKDNNRVVGVLALCADQDDYFRLEEVQVLTSLAADLSFAIESARKESERQAMEAAVHAGENLRALMFDAVPHAMFYLHVDGPEQYRFVSVNRAFNQLFETDDSRIVGKLLRELMPEGAWLQVARRYRTAIDTRQKVTWEEGWQRDGEPKCLEVTIAPVFDAQGRCSDFVGTTYDITPRVEAEAERARLVGQLNQAQRMQSLGTLAGGIAHDFNNILAAISGNAALLLQEDMPSQQRTHLREIEKASRRAIELVRQILTFSRHAPPKRETLDTHEVASEALNMLRATLPQTIAIETEFAADVPDIDGDPTQFHQVLMNLGTNAAHALPARDGVIRFSFDRFELESTSPRVANLASGCYLRMRVTDNGCGMDEKTLKRAFDPFFTTRQPGEGTGLGLSVVHGIVESHQGAVELRSQVGKGTLVTVYLPATLGRVESKPQARVTPGRGERVMYVDDEEALVFLMDRVLTRLGYRVSGFPDPTVALGAFRSRPEDFDVVVTDLSMPLMSGPDLAVELRRIRPDVPIIMTSGFIRAADVRMAERLHINQLVYKASTIDELGVALAREIARLRERAGIANDERSP